MPHRNSRRIFLKKLTALTAAATLAFKTSAAPLEDQPLIIDTHQHMWDLDHFKLPWLQNAPEIYRQNYRTPEYQEATKGLNIKAVYMEVDVDAAQRQAEAEYVISLAKAKTNPTIAAVIGGRPDSPHFENYIKPLKQSGVVKGVRQVLHGDLPAGTCLKEDFIKGIQFLGTQNLSFDLCMRPTELDDAVKLIDQCPETNFILDHCGNGDPKTFLKNLPEEQKPAHDLLPWQRNMEALAKRKYILCKISGIVASAPKDWTPDHLAPIVNFCLDTFGPKKVIFGGDWPVCLAKAKLADWIKALQQITATRPKEDQTALWSQNAINHYTLKM
jgi:predicted TIM-barrel fold metal-dependent hydrolase